MDKESCPLGNKTSVEARTAFFTQHQAKIAKLSSDLAKAGIDPESMMTPKYNYLEYQLYEVTEEAVAYFSEYGKQPPILSEETNRDLLNFGFLYLSSVYNRVGSMQVIGSRMASAILQTIMDVASGSIHTKYSILSGQIRNLMPFVMELGILTKEGCADRFETSLPNPGCPAHVDIGFNASLRFELSRRGADYFVRVFFNGRPVPVCGAARCPLAVFRDLWAAKFLVSAEELRAVCFGEGSEAQAAGGLTLGLGAGLWGLGVVGLGIVGLVLFVNRRKKLYREKKQQYSELP